MSNDTGYKEYKTTVFMCIVNQELPSWWDPCELMLEKMALAGKQGLHVKNEPLAVVVLDNLELIKSRPEGIVHPFSIMVKYLFNNQYHKMRVWKVV